MTIFTQSIAILRLTGVNRSELLSRKVVILWGSVARAIHVFVVHVGKSLPDVLDLGSSTSVVNSIIKHHESFASFFPAIAGEESCNNFNDIVFESCVLDFGMPDDG